LSRVENSPESPVDVRLRFELFLTAMNDMIDLWQYIRDEQVDSVKIVLLEELISVMNKVRFYSQVFLIPVGLGSWLVTIWV
jgi:hypothetical protein